jgi:carbon-monoxide dehydrogenase medium subunit
LIVHRAVCQVCGPQGEREIAVEDFCLAPGQTALRPGEFLVSIRIPPPEPSFGAHYLRFIPRNEMDIAVASAGAAVALNEDGARFRWARIALGAVAPIPLFVREAGDWLVGREVTLEAIREAAQMAQAAAQPIDDMRGTVAQRRHLAGVLARRALEKAIDRARN